jgi:hypothetical protein
MGQTLVLGNVWLLAQQAIELIECGNMSLEEQDISTYLRY